MRVPSLHGLPPLFSMVLILLAAGLSGIIFSFVFAEFGEFLFGFNAITGDSRFYFSNPSPDVVNSLRFSVFGQHLGMFILPGIFLARFLSSSPSNFLSTKQSYFSSLGWIILVFVLSLPAIELLVALNEWLLPESYFQSPLSEGELLVKEQTKLLLRSSSATSLLVNIFLIAIVPAVGEEFFFRGIIQGLFFRSLRNVHLAIFLTAVLFSLAHYELSAFIPRLGMGLLLGYVLVITNSMAIPILLHFLNNLTAVLWAHFYGVDALQEVSILNSVWMGLLFTLLLLVVLFLFIKNQSWKKNTALYSLNVTQ